MSDGTPIVDLMPSDALMQIAWVDALRFAIADDKMVAAFREETGDNWKPGRTPLDRMRFLIRICARFAAPGACLSHGIVPE
jgi:hypothetical protein